MWCDNITHSHTHCRLEQLKCEKTRKKDTPWDLYAMVSVPILWRVTWPAWFTGLQKDDRNEERTHSVTCLSFKTVLLIYKKSFTQREFAQQMFKSTCSPFSFVRQKKKKHMTHATIALKDVALWFYLKCVFSIKVISKKNYSPRSDCLCSPEKTGRSKVLGSVQ